MRALTRPRTAPLAAFIAVALAVALAALLAPAFVPRPTGTIDTVITDCHPAGSGAPLDPAIGVVVTWQSAYGAETMFCRAGWLRVPVSETQVRRAVDDRGGE